MLAVTGISTRLVRRRPPDRHDALRAGRRAPLIPATVAAELGEDPETVPDPADPAADQK